MDPYLVKRIGDVTIERVMPKQEQQKKDSLTILKKSDSQTSELNKFLNRTRSSKNVGEDEGGGSEDEFSEDEDSGGDDEMEEDDFEESEDERLAPQEAPLSLVTNKTSDGSLNLSKVEMKNESKVTTFNPLSNKNVNEVKNINEKEEENISPEENKIGKDKELKVAEENSDDERLSDQEFEDIQEKDWDPEGKQSNEEERMGVLGEIPYDEEEDGNIKIKMEPDSGDEQEMIVIKQEPLQDEDEQDQDDDDDDDSKSKRKLNPSDDDSADNGAKKTKKDSDASSDSDTEADKSAIERKVTNMRRNIREVMDENQLDEATLAAQREEMERLRRVQEQQRIIREVNKQISINRQNNKTQTRVISLLQGNTSLLKTTPGSSSAPKSATPNTVLVKLSSGSGAPQVVNKKVLEILRSTKSATPSSTFASKTPNLAKTLLSKPHMMTPSVSIAPVKPSASPSPTDEDKNIAAAVRKVSGKPKGKDVVTISSSSSDEDDCILISEPSGGEESEQEEDPTNSGMHTNDTYNIPDDQGRVLINVGRPENEPDVFLAPQIARIIKPHQIGGVRFLFDNIVESLERYKTSTGFGCILAHSMGLGKTLQVVSFCDVFLRYTEGRTVLCIMPINTLQNWLAEFNMWLPADISTNSANITGEVRPRTFPIFVLNDMQKSIMARAKVIAQWAKEGGVLLIGYELYRQLSMQKPRRARRSKKKLSINDDVDDEKNKPLLEEMHAALVKPGPDLVICDEGHRIKNSHASISQALKMIRSKRRIVLTGYPLQNNLLEYWCMVDFVRPNYLGTKTEFSNMFERPIQNGQCIDSTPQDIRLMRYRAHVLHSLLEGFVQRRSHSVLQNSLPQKEEYVLLVRMTAFQRKLYDTFMNEVVRTKAVPNPLKAFAVCCKIWNHPDVLYHFLKKRAGGEAVDLDLEEAAASIAPPTPVPSLTSPVPGMPVIPVKRGRGRSPKGTSPVKRERKVTPRKRGQVNEVQPVNKTPAVAAVVPNNVSNSQSATETSNTQTQSQPDCKPLPQELDIKPPQASQLQQQPQQFGSNYNQFQGSSNFPPMQGMNQSSYQGFNPQQQGQYSNQGSGFQNQSGFNNQNWNQNYNSSQGYPPPPPYSDSNFGNQGNFWNNQMYNNDSNSQGMFSNFNDSDANNSFFNQDSFNSESFNNQGFNPQMGFNMGMGMNRQGITGNIPGSGGMNNQNQGRMPNPGGVNTQNSSGSMPQSGINPNSQTQGLLGGMNSQGTGPMNPQNTRGSGINTQNQNMVMNSQTQHNMMGMNSQNKSGIGINNPTQNVAGMNMSSQNSMGMFSQNPMNMNSQSVGFGMNQNLNFNSQNQMSGSMVTQNLSSVSISSLSQQGFSSQNDGGMVVNNQSRTETATQNLIGNQGIQQNISGQTQLGNTVGNTGVSGSHQNTNLLDNSQNINPPMLNNQQNLMIGNLQPSMMANMQTSQRAENVQNMTGNSQTPQSLTMQQNQQNMMGNMSNQQNMLGGLQNMYDTSQSGSNILGNQFNNQNLIGSSQNAQNIGNSQIFNSSQSSSNLGNPQNPQNISVNQQTPQHMMNNQQNQNYMLNSTPNSVNMPQHSIGSSQAFQNMMNVPQNSTSMTNQQNSQNMFPNHQSSSNLLGNQQNKESTITGPNYSQNVSSNQDSSRSMAGNMQTHQNPPNMLNNQQNSQNMLGNMQNQQSMMSNLQNATNMMTNQQNPQSMLQNQQNSSNMFGGQNNPQNAIGNQQNCFGNPTQNLTINPQLQSKLDSTLNIQNSMGNQQNMTIGQQSSSGNQPNIDGTNAILGNQQNDQQSMQRNQGSQNMAVNQQNVFGNQQSHCNTPPQYSGNPHSMMINQGMMGNMQGGQNMFGNTQNQVGNQDSGIGLNQNMINNQSNTMLNQQTMMNPHASGNQQNPLNDLMQNQQGGMMGDHNNSSQNNPLGFNSQQSNFIGSLNHPQNSFSMNSNQMGYFNNQNMMGNQMNQSGLGNQNMMPGQQNTFGGMQNNMGMMMMNQNSQGMMGNQMSGSNFPANNMMNQPYNQQGMMNFPGMMNTSSGNFGMMNSQNNQQMNQVQQMGNQNMMRNSNSGFMGIGQSQQNMGFQNPQQNNNMGMSGNSGNNQSNIGMFGNNNSSNNSGNFQGNQTGGNFQSGLQGSNDTNNFMSSGDLNPSNSQGGNSFSNEFGNYNLGNEDGRMWDDLTGKSEEKNDGNSEKKFTDPLVKSENSSLENKTFSVNTNDNSGLVDLRQGTETKQGPEAKTGTDAKDVVPTDIADKSSAKSPKTENQLEEGEVKPDIIATSVASARSGREDPGIPYDWATELLKGYVPGDIEASAKMAVFFCILEESIYLGDRVLVFSQSLFTLNLIEDFLQKTNLPEKCEKWARNWNYFRLDGSTSAMEREKLINEFNSNPNIYLFLVSTRAGSLGINLVGANRVIVLDASWNPCHDTQAVCRVYRYGQKKPCFVYRLVTDNCLEKKIYDRQINKQGMADRVVDECNPDAHLSIKEVTNLCWDNEEDTESKDFSSIKDKYIDVIMQKLLQKFSEFLSKEPFQHESLLVDRKDKKLSQAEKRLAKRSYELEKQASINNARPVYGYYPGANVTNPQARGSNPLSKPMASVRPMQSELNNQLIRDATSGRPRQWITADVWQKQGMSAQEMTLPLDVVIPTNSPDRSSIVLKAGQKVMVLKSPKGIYMQLENGKIIAIRTAFKVGGNKANKTIAADKAIEGKKVVVQSTRQRAPPHLLRNNSNISIIPRNSPIARGLTPVQKPMVRLQGPNKDKPWAANKQPIATAKPYFGESPAHPPVTVTVTKKRMPGAEQTSTSTIQKETDSKNTDSPQDFSINRKDKSPAAATHINQESATAQESQDSHSRDNSRDSSKLLPYGEEKNEVSKPDQMNKEGGKDNISKNSDINSKKATEHGKTLNMSKEFVEPEESEDDNFEEGEEDGEEDDESSDKEEGNNLNIPMVTKSSISLKPATITTSQAISSLKNYRHTAFQNKKLMGHNENLPKSLSISPINSGSSPISSLPISSGSTLSISPVTSKPNVSSSTALGNSSLTIQPINLNTKKSADNLPNRTSPMPSTFLTSESEKKLPESSMPTFPPGLNQLKSVSDHSLSIFPVDAKANQPSSTVTSGAQMNSFNTPMNFNNYRPDFQQQMGSNRTDYYSGFNRGQLGGYGSGGFLPPRKDTNGKDVVPSGLSQFPTYDPSGYLPPNPFTAAAAGSVYPPANFPRPHIPFTTPSIPPVTQPSYDNDISRLYSAFHRPDTLTSSSSSFPQAPVPPSQYGYPYSPFGMGAPFMPTPNQTQPSQSSGTPSTPSNSQ